MIYGFLGFGSMYLASFIRSVTKLNFWAELLICFLIISIYFLVRVLKKNIQTNVKNFNYFIIPDWNYFNLFFNDLLSAKFGRLIAISSIISVGIILSAIVIAQKMVCNEVEGLKAQRFVGLNEKFSRFSSRGFKKFQKLIFINLRKKLKVINK